MENIFLPNREHYEVRLKYYCNTYDEEDFSKSYCFLLRVKDANGEEPVIWIHRNKTGIYGVDPEGGPYSGVGNIIEGMKVRQIQLCETKIYIYFYADEETDSSWCC